MQSIEIYSLLCSILFDFETIPRDKKGPLSSVLCLDSSPYLCTTVKPEMNQKKEERKEKNRIFSRLFYPVLAFTNVSGYLLIANPCA